MSRNEPVLPIFTKNVNRVFKSQTARNSSILFTGNTITSILSVVALLIVSRHLGPEKFGVITTFNAIWLTIITLTDFGLGTSAIKFISSHLVSNKRRAAIFMKIIFKLELLCGLIIGILGLIFSSAIANIIGGDNLISAVRYGFIAGMFASAGAFLGPFLMSYERFKTLSIFNVLAGVFRLAGILLLLNLAVLNTENILMLYTLIPALTFIAALLISPKPTIDNIGAAEKARAFKELFHFTKWIFLSTLAVIAFGRLDVLLISRLKGTTEVGLYGAAIQLTNFFPLIIGAIGGATLPWVSRLKSKGELSSYLKKSTAGVILVIIALIPLLFFSPTIINIVFGQEYQQSIDAFKLLFCGYLFTLLGSTMALIFYALDSPKTITLVNYVQLLFLIIFDFIYIPELGLNGAALGFLISQVIGTLLIISFTFHTIKRLPK